MSTITLALTPKQPGSVQALSTGTAYFTAFVQAVGTGTVEWAVFSAAGTQRAAWATIGNATVGATQSFPIVATGDYVIVRQPGGGVQLKSGSATVLPYVAPAAPPSQPPPGAGVAITAAPLVADGSGKIAGAFQIPPGIPVGSKLVKFRGQAGSAASASFVGRGSITIEELRSVQNIRTTVTDDYERYDPLAETFSLTAPALISGVNLWFCTKGAYGNTFVEIRRSQNGVPTSAVITSAVLPTTSLLTGQWQKFAWDPIRLDANVEYAIVVGADDATTACQIAELGQFDAAANQYVTSQPYQVGVLLSSSNGSTWSPDQTGDLTFQLLGTPTAASTTTIPLPPVTVTNCNELMVLAAIERPTSADDCVFQLTLPDGASTVITIGEGAVTLLPSTITGTIQWSAILTGSLSSTPRLAKDIQLVWGQRATTDTYVSRALVGGSSVNVTVYAETLTPGTSSIIVQAATTPAGPWTTIPLVSGTPVGDGWISNVYKLAAWNQQTAVLKVTQSGDAWNRPMLRKLRGVVTGTA